MEQKESNLSERSPLKTETLKEEEKKLEIEMHQDIPKAGKAEIEAMGATIIQETSQQLLLPETKEENKIDNSLLPDMQNTPKEKINVWMFVLQSKYRPVLKLIKEGKLPANLLIDKKNKWYLIHYLIMHNKPKPLDILINKLDCDVNIIDNYGQTALHLACFHFKPLLYKTLINHPLIQIEKEDEQKSTPLFNTVKSGFIAGFIYLYFERHANANLIDFNGQGFVHWAAYKNYIQYLRLFQHIPNMDFNSVDNFEGTPIQSAIKGLNYDAVKFLGRNYPATLSKKPEYAQFNKTAYELSKEIETQPHILSYLKKQKEFSEISQHGIAKYFQEKKIRNLKYILRYIKSNYGNYIFFSFLLISYLLLLSTSFYFYSTNPYSFIGFIISLICDCLSLWGFLSKKNPGYIMKKKVDDSNNAISDIIERVKNDDWSHLDRYCFTCLIAQNPGVFHCEKCNQCVSDYHGHLKSLYMGYCVGKNNYPFYFLFYVFAYLSLVFYINGVLNTAMPEPTSAFPIYYFEMLGEVLHLGGVFFGMTLIACIFMIQLSYSIFVMLHAASYHMTLNELRHPSKYRYLFQVTEYKHNYHMEGYQGMSEMGYAFIPFTYSECFLNLISFFKNIGLAVLGIESNQEELYIALEEVR